MNDRYMEEQLEMAHLDKSACLTEFMKLKFPIGGYAPGGYINMCFTCGDEMQMVDKRCRQCLSCAIDGLIKENVRLKRELEHEIQGT